MATLDGFVLELAKAWAWANASGEVDKDGNHIGGQEAIEL